ncbi:MAG TPA: radical SAM protein [Candidatus Acidoferrum sp.]|nr:radical SAM protein [Candidatus Acidoferrum sp.]
MNHELEHELGISQEEIATCLAKEGLLSLELEFTKKCNLRCTYCYSSAGEALGEELTLHELTGVIQQAAELGARKIVLLGGGEPFLSPHIQEVIRHIHSLGLSQAVFTNGALLTGELCRFLFDHRVSVAVKRNSFRPATQDALAGVTGAHRGIDRGLRLLMEAGYPAKDRPLCIQSVICRQNQDEIEEMWIWARGRGITPYFEVLTNQGRARQNPHLALTPAETQTVFQNLSEIDAKHFGAQWLPRPPIAGFTCRRHLYSCLVNSQGFVQPCTGVDLFVGNIREKTLAAVLRESQVIRDLRGIYRQIDPQCQTCGFAGECYGCRGNAYQATGNYLAADPACWLSQRKEAVDHCGLGARKIRACESF